MPTVVEEHGYVPGFVAFLWWLAQNQSGKWCHLLNEHVIGFCVA